MNHRKFLELAGDQARGVEAIGSSRHFCIITHKNRILATGSNSMKTHPFQLKYSRNEESIYLHAETDAIKRATNLHGTTILEKSSLYIVRVDIEGGWGLSRPCEGCWSCIEAFGLKKVIYSISPNEYGVIE